MKYHFVKTYYPYGWKLLIWVVQKSYGNTKNMRGPPSRIFANKYRSTDWLCFGELFNRSRSKVMVGRCHRTDVNNMLAFWSLFYYLLQIFYLTMTGYYGMKMRRHVLIKKQKSFLRRTLLPSVTGYKRFLIQL